MISKILSFYKDIVTIESFEDMPPSWQLVNPYAIHWDRFEFFIKKYYKTGSKRDLIIALNPGRKGCNKTGIALTDENVLCTKLGYPSNNQKPEVERTATRIWSIIEKLHPNLNTFFSKFFMTNIFPFGIVEDGKNVDFSKIIKIQSIKNFSKAFISKSIDIFDPEKIICIGRKSEEFMYSHFSDQRLRLTYLHHPARTFGEKEKMTYLMYLK